MIGHWKNFDELEENLSLAELEAILDAERKRQHSKHRFMAMLKGIDLDSAAAKSEEGDPFERAKAKAEAMQRGLSEEEYEFDDMGLGFESDEYADEDYFDEDNFDEDNYEED